MELPGFSPTSYGYRSDTGCKIFNSKCSIYGPRFTSGDTIGCGINSNTGALYFTKNGKFLGYAYYPVVQYEGLFCHIGLHCKFATVKLNFGSRIEQVPFLFNVQDANLPRGWKLECDNFGRFYFNREVSMDKSKKLTSFVDPREPIPLWKKGDARTRHDQLILTLSKPVVMKIPQQQQQQQSNNNNSNTIVK